MKQKSILMAFCLCAGAVAFPGFAASGSAAQRNNVTQQYQSPKSTLSNDDDKVADIDESELSKTTILEGTSDLNKKQAKKRGYIQESTTPAPKPDNEEKIFTAVECKARYPEGDVELLRWIGENIQYPAIAQEEGIQGRVVIQFVVEKDGSVGLVKVAREKHPALDAEAVRVIKSIDTKFIPAKQNGTVVRSWYTLPINFKLKEESSEQQTQQPAK